MQKRLHVVAAGPAVAGCRAHCRALERVWADAPHRDDVAHAVLIDAATLRSHRAADGGRRRRGRGPRGDALRSSAGAARDAGGTDVRALHRAEVGAQLQNGQRLRPRRAGKVRVGRRDARGAAGARRAVARARGTRARVGRRSEGRLLRRVPARTIALSGTSDAERVGMLRQRRFCGADLAGTTCSGGWRPGATEPKCRRPCERRHRGGRLRRAASSRWQARSDRDVGAGASAQPERGARGSGRERLVLRATSICAARVTEEVGDRRGARDPRGAAAGAPTRRRGRHEGARTLVSDGPIGSRARRRRRRRRSARGLEIRDRTIPAGWRSRNARVVAGTAGWRVGRRVRCRSVDAALVEVAGVLEAEQRRARRQSHHQSEDCGNPERAALRRAHQV